MLERVREKRRDNKREKRENALVERGEGEREREREVKDKVSFRKTGERRRVKSNHQIIHLKHMEQHDSVKQIASYADSK